MNIVAFETSSELISVAIGRGDAVYTREVGEAGQRSGELALPLMHTLLAEAGLAVADIDLVVFGRGPGSFTGVRVACGVAQGLAFGLGKRLIGLTSTSVIAAQVFLDTPTTTQVLVAIDARMGECYLGAYRRDDSQSAGFDEVLAPSLVSPINLAAALAGKIANGEWVGAGSAFGLPASTTSSVAVALRSVLGTAALQVVEVQHPTATSLLALAKRVYAIQGVAATIAPADAAPLYVRNNVAQTIEERRVAAMASRAPLTPITPQTPGRVLV